MAFLLRTTAFIAVLSSTQFLNAQDPATPAEVPVAASDAPAENTEGQTIYSVPSLKQIWEAQAVLNVKRDKVAHFSNDEDVIYVQSVSGNVTALNAESGRAFWSAQVGNADEVGLAAASDSRTVVIVAGPSIYGYEKFTGRKLFGYRLPDQPTAGPVLANGSVLVPVGNGSLCSYHLQDLNYLGRLNALPRGIAKAIDWRFTSGEMIHVAPVAGRDRVVVATEVGNIHAISLLEAEKGRAKFQFLMESRATAPLTLVTRDDKEYLLSMSAENRLFCIELQTNGLMKWTAQLSRPVTQPVIAIGQDVFVLSEDGDLAKYSLATGLPSEVSSGVAAIVSESVSVTERLPAFGAVIDVRAAGTLAFSPFAVTNRSTGQSVNAVTFDLSNPRLNLSFAVNELNAPVIRLVGDSAERTGVKSFTLSEDRKILTITFGDFAPEETLQFHADLEHSQIPSWKISADELLGASVEAYLSPTPAPGSPRPASGSDAVPPRKIIGRFSDTSQPWEVQGVKTLAAVSKNAVYFVDREDRLVGVNRQSSQPLTSMPIQDYALHLSNNLTDRICLSTTTGRVACFTEARIELGTLPMPTPGGFAWLLFPKTELATDFATFHQNPGRRPIMPDVPKTDPAAESDGAASP